MLWQRTGVRGEHSTTAKKGIDWRIAQGDVKDEDGQYKLFYQFRNRYPQKVKIVAKIAYDDNDGRQLYEATIIIEPNATNEQHYRIGRRVVSCAISKPQFIEEVKE